MDKLTRYRTYVHQILEPYTRHKPSYGDIEIQLIEDTTHDHYQIYHVGWDGHRRVHGCSLHLDIKNDKIWIQHDGTEIGMANELVKLGVPKNAIVLGFQAPYMRQHTEFAAG